MPLFSRKLENLQQLFLKELRDLYDGENQITEALPKLIEAAHHPELKNVLQEHRNVTKQQIARLNRIFEVLNEKPTGESCQGIKGLLKEGKEFASAEGDPGRLTLELSARRSVSSTTKLPSTVRCGLMPS